MTTEQVSGERLSLWMRSPTSSQVWMRIVKGGDPRRMQDTRVVVEEAPRVVWPGTLVWTWGPKSRADDGSGPDMASRRWADEKAQELGYVLPDMQREIGQLKASWYGDRSWDIEDTEGFEEHREELRAYRLDVEAREAKRATKEHEAAIFKLMQPGLHSLPESDPHGGLTRGEAERPEHAANRLLRAVAVMLLPVVERLHALDEQNDAGHLELANDIIRLSKMLP